MKHLYTLILVVFPLILASQEANDECANAEAITITTENTTTIDYNTINATESTDVSCENNFVYHDLWYSFTMPVNGNLRVTNADLFDYIAVFDACGGNEIACRNNNGFLYGFSANQDYILRIATRDSNANAKSLDIIAVVPDANDECVNANAITITTENATTINYNTINATESTDVSCENNFVYHDLWYSFTMPVNGNLRVTNADLFDYIAVFDACGGNEIACRNNNGFLYGFTANQDYILRISTRASNVNAKSLNIIAVVPDANDECFNANAITITTENATTIDYNTINATESTDVSCENNFVYHDLWYSFTMPVNGNLRVTNADLFDYIAVFDACGGNEIACRNNNGFLYGFTANQDYILRISTRASNVNAKSLNIIAVVPDANDECVNANAITITTENTTTIDYNTINATESTDVSCENNFVYHDLWYSFTMPVNGNLRVTNADLFDYITVFDTCFGTEIDCRSNNGLLFGFVANQDYILRISTRASNANAKSLNISVEGVVTNDDCSSSETIMVTNMMQNVPFQIAGATILNEEGCPSDIQNFGDIWYSFTMPEDGSVAITSFLNLNQFALYDACNGNLINCFTSDGEFDNLLDGNTYRLRVFREENDVSSLLALSFNIQLNNTLNIDDIALQSIKVYPNPVSDVLYVSTVKPIDLIEVFNLRGQKLLEFGNTTNINLRGITKGVYLIKLSTDFGSTTRRVIIN